MSLKVANRLRPHHVLLLILAVQTLLGLGYAASVPLWQGHEQDYFNVVRFLAEHGRLPTLADYPAGDADIRQATQPPVYFFAAALPLALFDNGQPVPLGVQPLLVCLGGAELNPRLADYVTDASYDFPPSGAAAAGYALRVLGVLFGLAAVAFTYLAGRTLFSPGIALASAALLAFEPNTLAWSAIISNDTLLLALAAANLWLCARLIRSDRLDVRLLLAILFTGALAVLTRLPGWAVLALDGLVLVAVIGRALFSRRLSRRQAQIGLIGLGLLVAAGAGVALFNVAQYGNVFGRYTNLDQVVGAALRDFRLPGVTLIGILDHTRLQYLGPLQMILPRETPVRLYGWLAVLCLFGAGFGLARALYLALRRRETPLGAFLLLLAAALASVALVVMRNLTAASDTNTTLYNTAYIFAPLRYYTPGLPAFALLFAAGLWALMFSPHPQPLSQGERGFDATVNSPLATWERGMRAINPLAALVALVWLAVAAGGVVYHAANRPADPRAPVVPPDAVTVEAGGTSDQPRVLAYTAAASEGMVDLTLYLTADTPLTSNYAAQFAMVDPSGSVANRCEVLPTGGAYPPTRWLPGEIVAARALIPNCAGALQPPLDLTLGWLPVTPAGDLGTGDSLPLLTLTDPLTESASCPPNLGTVAGSYRITRFNSPPEVRRGDPYVPSLNWLVLDVNPAAAARVFVFRQVETGAEYTCNYATYWASQWSRGEGVFFDGCVMQFPPDAPLGEYIAYAGLQDANFHWLPAAEEDGAEAAYVEVGRVQVGE